MKERLNLISAIERECKKMDNFISAVSRREPLTLMRTCSKVETDNGEFL